MTRVEQASREGAGWRLLVESAADAAWNMAVDEAMLEAYERGDPDSAPTLRLYGWRPAAVSLGKSQRAAGSHDERVLPREGIDLVRRPTGGDAVLHEFERTYAVVGRLDTLPFTGGVVATYRIIAKALTLGLLRLGVPAISVEPERVFKRGSTAACFERLGTWEVGAFGRKLVGSAQARRRTAFLQHGSIPYRLDPERLGAVLGSAVDGSRFIDLARAAGRNVDPVALDDALIHGFEETFGARMHPGRLSETESLRAAELRRFKYDSIAWTQEGVIGARESRFGPASVP